MPLSVHFSDLEYLHIVQLSPLSISRTFVLLSSQIECYLLTLHIPSPKPLAGTLVFSMNLTTLGTSYLLILYSLKHFLNILKDIFKEIRYVYNKVDFLVLINNLWQNTHNIKITEMLNFKYIVLWHSGAFLLLCSHYQHSPPELFSFCKTEPLYPLNHNYSLLLPTLGNHHSLCLHLTTLGT